MKATQMAIPGVVMFCPTAHHDDRGFFTRTFDVAVAREQRIAVDAFVQDSQSRSRYGTVRGLHGRGGCGEAKLIRCARGSIFDVVVDARPGSPTFGEHMSVVLDDTNFAHLYLPPGLLHGFQALTAQTDVCYRIDREHAPEEDLSVRFDDPALGVDWPLPVEAISAKDLAAGSWDELTARLGLPGRPARNPALQS